MTWGGENKPNRFFLLCFLFLQNSSCFENICKFVVAIKPSNFCFHRRCFLLHLMKTIFISVDWFFFSFEIPILFHITIQLSGCTPLKIRWMWIFVQNKINIFTLCVFWRHTILMGKLLVALQFDGIRNKM